MDKNVGLSWFDYAENDFEVAKIEPYHMQNALNDASKVKDFVLNKLTNLKQ